MTEVRCDRCDGVHCNKCATSIPATTAPQFAICSDCNGALVWAGNRAGWRHWEGIAATRCPRQTCPQPVGTPPEEAA